MSHNTIGNCCIFVVVYCFVVMYICVLLCDCLLFVVVFQWSAVLPTGQGTDWGELLVFFRLPIIS